MSRAVTGGEHVPGPLDGERVDRVVAMLWGMPRSTAAALVKSGGVRVDGAPVSSGARRVAAGERLEVDLVEPPSPLPEPEPGVPVEVVYVDTQLIVVVKPPGLVVHPGAGRRAGTLVNGLLARFPDIAGVGEPNRPGIVHRLDAGTSGLLAVARTPEAYRSLVAQLAARAVDRRYLALVWGAVSTARGVVDAPVGRADANRTRMAVSVRGREARTRYRVVTRYSDPVEVTLVECSLETGRTHQIRVHMAAIGHAVVGDAHYGGRRSPLPATRPFLHAHHLELSHPVTAERCQFESPLAPDLAEVLDVLG